jgi:hypothetical protein
MRSTDRASEKFGAFCERLAKIKEVIRLPFAWYANDRFL